MKYSCKHCDWVIEGQTQVTSKILEHEQTHTENDIANKVFEKDDGTKIRCRVCGCNKNHEV